MGIRNDKDRIMSIGETSGYAAANGLIGMGMTNFNNKNQLKQQQKLIEQQMTAQKEMSQFNQGLAMQMWEDTNYDAQRKQMEKAGLNVGLMYGMGGGGGGATATPSSGIGGASANPQAMGLEMLKTGQEMKLMEAQKNKIEAETENTKANTTTTNDTRDLLIENMRQSGTAQWLQNEITKYRNEFQNMNDDEIVNIIRNKIYGQQISLDNQSIEMKKLNADLLKTVADKDKALQDAILTNKKAMGYWQELINATIQADASKIQAEATKLSTEWNTGEYTNWKTWAELGMKGAEALKDLIKASKPIPTK